MKTISRRKILKALGAGGALSSLGLAGCASQGVMSGKAAAKVVVVGGGFGGATCAKYLKRFDSNLEVTLVEQNRQYTTCPGSNWVLGGLRGMDDITHGYGDLNSRYGVKVVHDTVTAIEPGQRRVVLAGGQSLGYDRLVVSPGIDFRWEEIEGYDASVAEKIPHAWKAGPQTKLLYDQLRAMPNGGTVLMAIPGNPFRCPPGPYERASMIAHYLKTNKPKSKILMLDTKDAFSKKGLFEAGWAALYPGMIEWVSGSSGGKVERVDAANRTVYAQSGLDQHKADVLNIIPPQRAGQLAQIAGLTNDSGWCPVNQQTFESSIHPGIHVIGDSSIAGAMPKSGHSANSQAKMTAAAIVAMLKDLPVISPSHVNTCYSLIGPDYGITVAAVYRLGDDGAIAGVKGAGGVSPTDVPHQFRTQEARYAEGWYASITQDSFR